MLPERERLNVSGGGESTSSCSAEGRKRQADRLLLLHKVLGEIALIKVPTQFFPAAEGLPAQGSRPPGVWAGTGRALVAPCPCKEAVLNGKLCHSSLVGSVQLC